MSTDNLKPCPVCGVELHRSDAERVAVDRDECPRSR